jgi:hypothetical protein
MNMAYLQGDAMSHTYRLALRKLIETPPEEVLDLLKETEKEASLIM